MKKRTVLTFITFVLLPVLLSGTAFSQGPIVTPDDARAHGLESLRIAIANDGGVPLPGNILDFVKDMDAAKMLGKALFWDMRVGSDGTLACASCHFHAGADNRAQNQLNPDILRVKNDRFGDVVGFHDAANDPDNVFEIGPPNHTLTLNDFPFVTDVGNGANVVEIGGTIWPAAGNSNDVASSMGIHLTGFQGVIAGDPFDLGVPLLDPVFNVDSVTTRRVEPRNTPTVINAVLNFANFWDGRANPNFNGQNPFGQQDPSAVIFERVGNLIQTTSIVLDNASLASQAVGPPLSFFEMSFEGRIWPDLGEKMLVMRALAGQQVAVDDSLLAGLRHVSGDGLTATYEALVQAAFHDRFWDDSGLAPSAYTLAESNFALFFGIAVMLYESTLISDATPFDRWMEGLPSTFGQTQLAGLNLFVNQGRCVNCHGGPELTNASVRNAQNGNNVIEPMIMGDNNPAMYDNGFYNISVTPTPGDLGRGGKDLNGKPLAFSRQFAFEALGVDAINFPIIGLPLLNLVCDPVDSADGTCDNNILGVIDEDTGQFIAVCEDLIILDGVCDVNDNLLLRRVAVDGAFKTPGLRNVELTGPYMHNGGFATLLEVIEFYNRGGNFCRFNDADLDPDIQSLGLTPAQKGQLLAFLLSLTDERVRRKAAPFDHPELRIPNGHPVPVGGPDGDGHLIHAADNMLIVQAVGATGLPRRTGLTSFLNANHASANPVLGVCDDIPPFCGDGNCDGNENPCNCPLDCGGPPASETNCVDGVDEDCDGNIDCADADCATNAACRPGRR